MSQSNTTIAVLGATGQQGGAVAEALLARGRAVRALVRNPESAAAQHLHDLGAELTHADLDRPETLRPAMEGAAGVYSVQTFTGPGGLEGEVRQGRAVADAVHDVRVPHLVYSSVGGAERHSGVPHFETKARVEEHIRQLALPATVLRPAFFMENFFGFGPTRRDDELVLRLPLRPQVPLQMVGVRDVGAFAALAFDNPTEYVGRAVEIAGDELTGPQVAAAFGTAAGLPGRYEQQPWEEMRAAVGEEVTTMFGWFDREGYQADIPALRAAHPTLATLPAWIDASGWAAGRTGTA